MNFILRVSINGYLSFSSRSVYPTPVGIPFKHSGVKLICPFWANLDTNAGGAVYYRHASGSTTIDNEIRRYFSSSESLGVDSYLAKCWLFLQPC